PSRSLEPDAHRERDHLGRVVLGEDVDELALDEQSRAEVEAETTLDGEVGVVGLLEVGEIVTTGDLLAEQARATDHVERLSGGELDASHRAVGLEVQVGVDHAEEEIGRASCRESVYA